MCDSVVHSRVRQGTTRKYPSPFPGWLEDTESVIHVSLPGFTAFISCNSKLILCASDERLLFVVLHISFLGTSAKLCRVGRKTWTQSINEPEPVSDAGVTEAMSTCGLH